MVTTTASPDSLEADPSPLIDGPAEATSCLLLAHGAGQSANAPFMQVIARLLAAAGLRVIRFRFPYMRRAEAEGRRRPPDPEPVLRAAWQTEIANTGWATDRLLIGGKSMGGRIASLIADDAGVAGLVCLGYPFHPPGKPQRLRIEHLRTLSTPALICQGTRDPFGTPEQVADYPVSRRIALHWIEDGEHSFKPRKKSGRDWDDNLADAARAVARFRDALLGTDISTSAADNSASNTSEAST